MLSPTEQDCVLVHRMLYECSKSCSLIKDLALMSFFFPDLWNRGWKKSKKKVSRVNDPRDNVWFVALQRKTFIGQDTQLQSSHVKHKWRARHTQEHTDTSHEEHSCPRGQASPLPAEARSFLYCCSFPPFQFARLVRFAFCFAGPGLCDVSRCVPNTTMGTAAAAREQPACNSHVASGCSFIFTHIRQLWVPASFSAPLFSTWTAQKQRD